MGAANTIDSPHRSLIISRRYCNGGIKWLEGTGQSVSVVLNYT